MALIHRTLTARGLWARRRNARKSTGPRTEGGKQRAALNALAHGGFARWPWRSMLALDEDPRDFAQLLEALVAAHHPGNLAERMLVEDIARLRWRQQRNQRAQEGLVLRGLERLKQVRAHHEVQVTQDTIGSSAREALDSGLLSIPDSPAKFKEVRRILRLVQEEVERGVFTPAGHQLLLNIYGPQPSLRGIEILGMYRHFLDSGCSPPEDLKQACAAGTSGDAGENAAPENGGALAGGGATPAEAADADACDRMMYVGLRLALLEEQRELVDRYEAYLTEHLQNLRALQAAALTPSASEWRALTRQEKQLEEQIERKTRLLSFLQWAERKRRQDKPKYGSKKAKLESPRYSAS
jgi:hypothetical protein